MCPDCNHCIVRYPFYENGFYHHHQYHGQVSYKSLPFVNTATIRKWMNNWNRFASISGISIRRLGCTVAVLIGIFISVEPQIWSLPGNGSDSAGGSYTAHVIWPMTYAIGVLPAAIRAIVCERELKQEKVSWYFVVFFFFLMLWQTRLPPTVLQVGCVHGTSS